MSPHDTWRSSALTNTLAWVCSIVLWVVCLCYTMFCKLTTMCKKDTWHYCAQGCLPLGYQIDNTWHLPLVCLILHPPCILKCKIVISSIPTCYAKCHHINIFHLKCYLCWQIVSYWYLADVKLWNIWTSSLDPLQIVYVVPIKWYSLHPIMIILPPPLGVCCPQDCYPRSNIYEIWFDVE